MIKNILSYAYVPLSLTPYIYHRFFSNRCKFELFDDIFIPIVSIGTGAIYNKVFIDAIDNFDKTKFIEKIMPDNNTFKIIYDIGILSAIILSSFLICERYRIRI